MGYRCDACGATSPTARDMADTARVPVETARAFVEECAR